MTDIQLEYYQKMLEKRRLVPILIDGKLRGIITFYIGSIVDKYVRDNPWTIINDEPDSGTICFIDQLITNKKEDNPKYSFKVINDFKNFIKFVYPKVRVMRWNRIKHDPITNKENRYVFYKSVI